MTWKIGCVKHTSAIVRLRSLIKASCTGDVHPICKITTHTKSYTSALIIPLISNYKIESKKERKTTIHTLKKCAAKESVDSRKIHK